MSIKYHFPSTVGVFIKANTKLNIIKSRNSLLFPYQITISTLLITFNILGEKRLDEYLLKGDKYLRIENMK